MNTTIEQWVNGDLSFLFDDDMEKNTKKFLERQWGIDIMKELDPTKKKVVHWTGPLGQIILERLLPHGWVPKKIKGQPIPDWETKKYVYEIKAQSYNGFDEGTTYEKVGILKHRNTTINYGKPLKIICIGFLEPILKKRLFVDDDRLDEYLKLGASWDIEFLWGSYFVNKYKHLWGKGSVVKREYRRKKALKI